MNDLELDRLLDTWRAPSAPPSLRAEIRRRFPRSARFGFARPLRWAAVIAVAWATVGIATEQSGGSGWDFVVAPLERLFDAIQLHFETHQAAQIVDRMRQSQVRVLVNGVATPAVPAANDRYISVRVPGEGEYQILLITPALFGRAKEWMQNGNLQGNILQFQAGAKQVRVEYDRAVTDSARPVYTRQAPK